jgi:hypothetical protein
VLVYGALIVPEHEFHWVERRQGRDHRKIWRTTGVRVGSNASGPTIDLLPETVAVDRSRQLQVE